MHFPLATSKTRFCVSGALHEFFRPSPALAAEVYSGLYGIQILATEGLDPELSASRQSARPLLTPPAPFKRMQHPPYPRLLDIAMSRPTIRVRLPPGAFDRNYTST